MKHAALDLIDLGWRLFPVARDGRTPLVKRGCYAASRDAAQVEAWWTRWPMANVALACGPESGVLALDVDNKPGADGFGSLDALQAEFGKLPRTVLSRTPSGGVHLLFAHPSGARPQNRVGIKRYDTAGGRRLYAGLDVRGAGASICLPPSAKDTGPYTWERSPFTQELAEVPAWLLSLMLSEPPPRKLRPLDLRGSTERVARYVVAAVNNECAAVANTPAGAGRNQRLFIAAARLGELVGAAVLQQGDAEAALEKAAGDCGLVREDGLRAVRSTIASGLKRGICQPREIAA